MSKYCNKCSESKSLEEFFNSKNSPDGFGWYCKACVSSQTRQWAVLHPARVSEISHKHSVSENTRKKRRKDYQENKEVWPLRGKKDRMRPESKRSYRDGHLQRTYGITLEVYEKTLLDQQGVCFICKKQETVLLPNNNLRPLSVDHDHKTGKVRKLLCHRCNTVLGLICDDPHLIKQFLKYLFLHE